MSSLVPLARSLFYQKLTPRFTSSGGKCVRITSDCRFVCYLSYNLKVEANALVGVNNENSVELLYIIMAYPWPMAISVAATTGCQKAETMYCLGQ